MAESSSSKVVYAALAGNVLVALGKYGAAAASGSGAMLTEAMHSTADSVNQVLLLIGNKRSSAPADDTHNFGHGQEVYFWTFVVAVLVLLGGGAASLTEGIIKLRTYEVIASPVLSTCVLAVSAVFEGATFAIGIRESRRVRRRHVIAGHSVGFWKFIQLSKDPNLYETLLEDAAALVGLAVAAAGIAASAWLKWLWADGTASCAIGVLLIADALVILSATRSLISGESVAPAFRQDILKAIGNEEEGMVQKVETLHLGPEAVLVALTLSADSDERRLPEMTRKIKAVDSRIAHVLVRSL